MDDISTEISERGAASVCPGRKTGSAVDDGIVAELLAGKLGLVKIYDDFAVNPFLIVAFSKTIRVTFATEVFWSATRTSP